MRIILAPNISIVFDGVNGLCEKAVPSRSSVQNDATLNTPFANIQCTLWRVCATDSSACARCVPPCTCALTGRAGEQGVKFSSHPEPYTDGPGAQLRIINTHTRQETSKYGPTCFSQRERDCASAGRSHCSNSSCVVTHASRETPLLLFFFGTVKE